MRFGFQNNETAPPKICSALELLKVFILYPTKTETRVIGSLSKWVRVHQLTETRDLPPDQSLALVTMLMSGS